MTTIWIVMISDRHTNVDPKPFTQEGPALQCARDWASAWDEIEEMPLTNTALNDGWVLCIGVGIESDCVWVVERELEGPLPT